MSKIQATKFISSAHWGHIFAGSQESATRWVFDLEKDQLVVAQIKGTLPGAWLNLSQNEAADLLGSIYDNECLGYPDLTGCVRASSLPSWAQGQENVDVLAKASKQRLAADSSLFSEAAPSDAAHREMIVALQNLLSSPRGSSGRIIIELDHERTLTAVLEAAQKTQVHRSPSRDAADQETIAKALHLEASQISAFMYAGAIQCDLDRWEGHVGFVANCAELSLDIAGFLKENADTENPGVIAYELFEPFGKWMAEEGHLPLKNSLLDEFKQQYHAWIEQGQACMPRESSS